MDSYDINTTNEYKYLGTWINNTLSSQKALKVVAEQATYTGAALYPILSKNFLRFNINAYTMYVLPKLIAIPLFLENKTRHSDF